MTCSKGCQRVTLQGGPQAHRRERGLEGKIHRCKHGDIQQWVVQSRCLPQALHMYNEYLKHVRLDHSRQQDLLGSNSRDPCPAT